MSQMLRFLLVLVLGMNVPLGICKFCSPRFNSEAFLMAVGLLGWKCFSSDAPILLAAASPSAVGNCEELL